MLPPTQLTISMLPQPKPTAQRSEMTGRNADNVPPLVISQVTVQWTQAHWPGENVHLAIYIENQQNKKHGYFTNGVTRFYS